MEAVSSSQLAEIVAECQARAKSAADRLLKTFGFVPEERLKWSPSKTARTSLAIVAHCVQANQLFATVIRGDPMPPMPSPEEMRAEERRFEATITNRADAVRRLEASSEEVVAALGTMTPERYAASPNSPFGPLPMSFWTALPAAHLESHAAQIDYLQTIWGDLADHM